MVDFGSDGRIGAKWNAATRTIAYGRPQKDGHYHAFIADADGANERRVAFAAWRDDRHQFPAAWHPAGELLAMLVEQNEHERSSVDAIPGYGAYTDYWIVTPRRQPRLEDLRAFPTATTMRSRTPRSRPTAASSPGPSASRRRASGTSTCSPAATSSRSPTSSLRPEPHLENVRTIQPGNVDQGGEIESIAADNRTIAFYSTYVSKNLFASRIYTMDIESGVDPAS